MRFFDILCGCEKDIRQYGRSFPYSIAIVILLVLNSLVFGVLKAASSRLLPFFNLVCNSLFKDDFSLTYHIFYSAKDLMSAHF